MEIREVTDNKRDYLPLLLLGDEQESMIARYLDRGTLYVLDDQGVKGLCVVTDEGGGVLELKNLAVEPAFQGKGYGRAAVEKLIALCRESGKYDVLGLGCKPENAAGMGLYKSLGFTPTGEVEHGEVQMRLIL